MKKVLFTAVAVLGFTFANAQDATSSTGSFAKGDIFVSGKVGFDSSKQGDAKSNEFTFSPAAGFFVSDNIAVGARLMVVSGEDTAETKSNEFGGEVFGRYYVTPTSQFSLFAEVNAGFGTEKTETVANVETKYNKFGVHAGLGLSYFLSNNFAIEASWAGLGYDSRKLDATGADAKNTFGLNVDLRSFGFGVVYKF